MTLHYKGKYDLNPASLPHGEHQPGAVRFREAEDTKAVGRIGLVVGIILLVVLLVPLNIRCQDQVKGVQRGMGAVFALLSAFPHEILHAACFREDVYLYTNWKQGMLFVVGPETMSKGRFIAMSMLPNLIFGMLPYAVGMLMPQASFLGYMGALCIAMGAGDYYNVFNALTQMPAGARTYLYQFHSYWYMPERRRPGEQNL